MIYHLYVQSKKATPGVPVVAQWKCIQLGTMRLRVQSLASLIGLRIRCYYDLWCRSQTQLGSGVAVAVAVGWQQQLYIREAQHFPKIRHQVVLYGVLNMVKPTQLF